MLKYITTALILASFASARPKENNVPTNLVTVPTNCPEGQELVNGVCRDIWRYAPYRNALMARDVSQYKKENVPLNMITVPTNCPPGQQLVNGVCRDIWRFGPTSPIPPVVKESAQHRIENSPLNMVTVPTNCPPGQQLVNGVCRDIWSYGTTSPIPLVAEASKNTNLEEVIKSITSKLLSHREKRQVNIDAEEILQLLDEANTNRNIISVPNQCPAGYKPDILGICRQIFD